MTTTLSDIFDPDAFYRYIDRGFISVRKHNNDPDLRIADYTQETQFKREWTPETLASRGLIFRESTGEIVARGFPKFFNWDDASQPYPRVGPVLLSTKFDGSLGIAYVERGTKTLLADPNDPEDEDYTYNYATVRISTRGSFHSEQAEHASERYVKYVNDSSDGTGPDLGCHVRGLLERGFTPLFEIIYPSNRIVVDYGGADSLVLLDVIDNRTGASSLAEFDALDWPEKADKISLKGGFTDALPASIPDDEEGFVLYWPESNFRCKVKGATYVHLHSILTETSSRDLWRNMAVHACKGYIEKPTHWGSYLNMDPNDAFKILAGHEDWLPAILEGVPDEFYTWVRITINSIQEKVDAYTAEATRLARTLAQEPDGKVRWQMANEHGEIGAVALGFANYDNEGRMVLAAWRNAFPAFEKPFANVEE